jgi:hypothetical protein
MRSFLRRLFIASLLALLPGAAAAQVCSAYLRCPSGYICSKPVPGSFMGTCVKGGAAAAKVAAACELRHSRDECVKSDLCAWQDMVDSCTTRCELRNTRDTCTRTSMCDWVDRIETCVTKCSTWRSQDACAKDERCGWIEDYQFCLTRRDADLKPRPK